MRSRLLRLGFGSVCLALLSALQPAAAQLRGDAQARGDAPAPPPAPATMRDGFTLAVGGDLLGSFQAVMVTPDYDKIWDLFRKADAGLANLEGNLFDLKGFDGWPASENGGGNAYGEIGGGPLKPAATAPLLKSVGLNLISVANNHGFDWQAQGLLATLKNLDAAGLTYAGGGRNLAFAREAGFRDTAHGRVALVAAAATILPEAVAGAGDGERNGRPGLSALRITPVVDVTDAEFDALKSIAARMGQAPSADGKALTLYTAQTAFTYAKFARGATPGLHYEVNPADRAGILAAISAGKRGADMAVFSIHAHESASGAFDSSKPFGDSVVPPAYLRDFLHAAVDAGADTVVVHGPHVLRGIEIYKGKPIFYGMSSLLYGLGLALGSQVPQEWDDSVVAVSTFRDGQVAEIRLYPIVHAVATAARSDASAPKPASPADARRIITYLQTVSAPFGTDIRFENGIGVIRPHIGATTADKTAK